MWFWVNVFLFLSLVFRVCFDIGFFCLKISRNCLGCGICIYFEFSIVLGVGDVIRYGFFLFRVDE